MSRLIFEGAPLPEAGPGISLKVAEDCVRHGYPLPPDHVRHLLEFANQCRGSAETAERAFTQMLQLARYRQDKVARVPAEVALRFRNQIRALLGRPITAVKTLGES